MVFENLQHADQALMRHEFREACALYCKILDNNSDALREARRLNDVIIDLARCEWEVGDLEQAQERLTQLLRTELSHRQQVESQILLARICHALGKLEQAFALLHLTEERLPKESWARRDRVLHSRLSLLLDEACEQQMLKAQRAFAAADYSTAVEGYTSVLHAAERGTYPTAARTRCTPELCENLRFRIGECHYLNGEETQVITWLSSCGDAGTHSSFLAGLAHKRAGQPLEAIARFAEFLASAERSAPEIEETEWHLGCSCLAADRFDEARTYFSRRLRASNHPKLACMAQLYLARIDYKQGKIEEAQAHLEQLCQKIPWDDPLHREVVALRAELLFHQGNLVNAAEQLEYATGAITVPDPWYADALYALTQCYLELAQSGEGEASLTVLDKAAATCHRLVALTGEPRSHLSLAQIKLLQAQRTNAPLCTEQFVQGEESLPTKTNQIWGGALLPPH